MKTDLRKRLADVSKKEKNEKKQDNLEKKFKEKELKEERKIELKERHQSKFNSVSIIDDFNPDNYY